MTTRKQKIVGLLIVLVPIILFFIGLIIYTVRPGQEKIGESPEATSKPVEGQP